MACHLRMTVRAGFFVASVVLALALTGCSSTGFRGAVTQAVKESASAVESGRLAYELGSAGKLTPAATSTTLDDARDELEKTRTTVGGLQATGQDDLAMRNETLAILNDSIAAVLGAADAGSGVEGSPSPTETEAELRSVSSRLADLQTKLGAQ